MKDSPRAWDLLEAVARTLSEQVLPDTQGSSQHAVRVAANLCRIAAREIDAPPGDDIDRRLAELVDLGPDEDLATALDDRLRRGDPDFDDAVFDLLLDDVRRRVDIAKPGYSDGHP